MSVLDEHGPGPIVTKVYSNLSHAVRAMKSAEQLGLVAKLDVEETWFWEHCPDPESGDPGYGYPHRTYTVTAHHRITKTEALVKWCEANGYGDVEAEVA